MVGFPTGDPSGAVIGGALNPQNPWGIAGVQVSTAAATRTCACSHTRVLCNHCMYLAHEHAV
jgi:hypothetical protein